jgi:hypothetical protein
MGEAATGGPGEAGQGDPDPWSVITRRVRSFWTAARSGVSKIPATYTSMPSAAVSAACSGWPVSLQMARPSRQPSTPSTAGLPPGVNRTDSVVASHILWYATVTPSPSTASVAMCSRSPSPRTGAPTSATEPASAQAATIAASRGSAAVIAGASSS